jgi:hypothetical protein
MRLLNAKVSPPSKVSKEEGERIEEEAGDNRRKENSPLPLLKQDLSQHLI